MLFRSIQTRNYQNNEGRTVYITEVVVDNFQMLESKSVTDSRRAQSGGGQQQQQQQNRQGGNYSNSGYGNNSSNSNCNNNYSNNNQTQQSNNANAGNNNNPFANIDFGNDDPFESNDDVTDISDDDLPF